MTAPSRQGIPQVASGGPRLCGPGRHLGGVYLEGAPTHESPRVLLDPPIAIDPQQFGLVPLGVSYFKDAQGVTHVLDWVGTGSYPTVQSFLEEGSRLGFSRKVAVTSDLARLGPQSTMMFVHARAYLENPAALAAFAPDFHCPCEAAHPAAQSCAGWHPHLAAPGDRGVKPLAPGAPEPRLSPGVFAQVPLGAVSVVGGLALLGEADQTRLKTIKVRLLEADE